MFTFRFLGADTLQRRIASLSPEILRQVEAALLEQAEAVMADSKEHYVPVDVAALKNSGHVQPPVSTGNELSITLGYGGAARAYAIVQHERMDFRHTVGGPKYLERPLLAAAARIRAALHAAVRKAIGS
jgi:hypothetical protein